MNIKASVNDKEDQTIMHRIKTADNVDANENDTSDNTKAIFNIGTTSLFNNPNNKLKIITSKDKIPIPLPNNNINKNNNKDNIIKPQEKNILQNLPKNESNLNNNIPNSSLYSSGYLSFRNKKANILNPNLSNNSKIMEEQIDPEIITQSILQKFNSIKQVNNNNNSLSNDYINQNSSSNSTSGNNKYNLEQKEIGKFLFHNNESTKAYEEELDDNNKYLVNEQMNKNNNNNFEADDYEKFSCDNAYDNDDNNKNNIKRNIFLDLGNDNKIDNDDINILINSNNDDEDKKEKVINTIICTLSILEKGRAIFVSQDDIIFILPSLFIPKNLKVGNTYMFVISEYEDYNCKFKEVKDIQDNFIDS